MLEVSYIAVVFAGGLAGSSAVGLAANPSAAPNPKKHAKLADLFDEDIREQAMSEDIAAAIFPSMQAVIEAFDAAAEGRRPGERMGPIVREQPKVGRNEPCPCDSGKKCCGHQ